MSGSMDATGLAILTQPALQWERKGKYHEDAGPYTIGAAVMHRTDGELPAFRFTLWVKKTLGGQDILGAYDTAADARAAAQRHAAGGRP